MRRTLCRLAVVTLVAASTGCTPASHRQNAESTGGTAGSDAQASTGSGGTPREDGAIAAGGTGNGGQPANGGATGTGGDGSDRSSIEVLYDFGRNGPGQGLRMILADERYLYWLQDDTGLRRAPKSPGGAVELLVPDATASSASQGWLFDGDFLFFDAATHIGRLDRKTKAVTDFPLGHSYATLVLASSEGALHLAEPGCGTMMKMDEATGALSEIVEKEAGAFAGGTFAITVAGGNVYCSAGAGGVLYRRPVSGGVLEEALRLKDDDPVYQPQVGSMLAAGTNLYLLRSHAGQLPPTHVLARVDVSKDPLGSVSDLTPNLTGPSGSLVFDDARQTFYWASGGNLYAYLIPGGAFSLLALAPADAPADGYLASDADYLYFHTRDPQVRIMRFKK